MGSQADAFDARELGPGPSFHESFAVPGTYLAWAIGMLAAVFVALALGRVVLDAANASARVEQLRATNAELRARVDALAGERQLVTSPIFVQVAGRGRGYGEPTERAFGLLPSGPPPPRLISDDGPGADRPSPLDAWLSLLPGG